MAGDPGPPEDPGTGTGPTWGFWLALLTAVHPVLVASATAHLLLTSTRERLQPYGPGFAEPTTTDRWALVVRETEPGGTTLLCALLALLVAAAVTSSRPAWMRSGAVGAWSLGALGTAVVLLGVGGVAAHGWNARRDLTALEAPPSGVSISSVDRWALLDVTAGVAAVLVGVLVTVLAVRHATRPGGPGAAGGRTVGG